MNPGVIVSPEAAADLESQLVYLLGRDYEAAGRLQQAVFSAFQELVASPELGTARRSVSTRLNQLRMWPVTGFPHILIYYQPRSYGMIEIVQLLHARQDRDGLLGDEGASRSHDGWRSGRWSEGEFLNDTSDQRPPYFRESRSDRRISFVGLAIFLMFILWSVPASRAVCPSSSSASPDPLEHFSSSPNATIRKVSRDLSLARTRPVADSMLLYEQGLAELQALTEVKRSNMETLSLEAELHWSLAWTIQNGIRFGDSRSTTHFRAAAECLLVCAHLAPDSSSSTEFRLRAAMAHYLAGDVKQANQLGYDPNSLKPAVQQSIPEE